MNVKLESEGMLTNSQIRLTVTCTGTTFINHTLLYSSFRSMAIVISKLHWFPEHKCEMRPGEDNSTSRQCIKLDNRPEKITCWLSL